MLKISFIKKFISGLLNQNISYKLWLEQKAYFSKAIEIVKILI